MLTAQPTTNQPGYFKNIYLGWKNLFVRQDKSEIVARERSVICSECSHQSLGVCGLCGCPLKAKQRAPANTCPDNRWLS